MSVTSGSNDVMPGSGLVPVAADLRTTDKMVHAWLSLRRTKWKLLKW